MQWMLFFRSPNGIQNILAHQYLQFTKKIINLLCFIETKSEQSSNFIFLKHKKRSFGAKLKIIIDILI